jgi:hypothetical protein
MRPDSDYDTWRYVSGNEEWRISEIEGESFFSRWYDDCSAGYICLEGATYKEPVSIALHGGYPCPIGFYCETGAVIEKPCPPGTYNDALYASVCKPCEPGYICPVWGISYLEDPDQDGTVESLATYMCPLGYYCEGGDIDGTPCPAGRFDEDLETGYTSVD